MHIYILICTCIFLKIYIYIYINTDTDTDTHTHTHKCRDTYVDTHTHARTHTRTRSLFHFLFHRLVVPLKNRSDWFATPIGLFIFQREKERTSQKRKLTKQNKKKKKKKNDVHVTRLFQILPRSKPRFQNPMSSIYIRARMAQTGETRSPLTGQNKIQSLNQSQRMEWHQRQQSIKFNQFESERLHPTFSNLNMK